jgi:hypothetical protein
LSHARYQLPLPDDQSTVFRLIGLPNLPKAEKSCKCAVL